MQRRHEQIRPHLPLFVANCFLPEPNWKEKQRLGARIDEGYRLACQLWLTHDIELSQEALANADQPKGQG